ncbi:polyribonucleotide nucleotidyltransferase [Pseudomonas sp. AN-1]|uniref:polyribonucleotide nucleotidyltransferase n=1 Tax=Pseudomonas sp. AN-1 TaxID=3096605 RepID=UPI002A69954F|nr:polyribonucleotide nucleotidyltransferase [Pseudomonas sp. AN-1]WPP43935.1 polyribonucleotide nucleotidyltransferase [Pseudomonas sp. AN-1]
MRTSQRIVSGVLAATLLAQLSGCGTLFYPDRRGQLKGQIDPAIAALDAIGILFFVIPGLIAFAIDFGTGAIYLPEGRYSVAPERLQEAVGSDGRVDPVRLRAILQQELARDLPLDDPRLIRHGGSVEQLAAYGLPPAA